MFKNKISPFKQIQISSLNTLSALLKTNKHSSSLYKFSIKTNFDQIKDRPKRNFILLYKFIEDMNYKRIPYRDDHVKLVEQFEQNGSVILGGSFFPNDGACILFQANDETIPDSFVKKDPYFKNGLVKDYEIKEIEMLQKKKMDDLAIYYKYR